MVYTDFESILVPEENGKQNHEEFYKNISQKHVACSYDYKLVCTDDNFSYPFKSYLGKDAIYNFINSMIKESKYRNEMMNKHFNKELVMAKEDQEDFENCTNYWIFDSVCIEVFVKVRAHFHKHGTYRASAHGHFDIKNKLN